MTILLGDTGTVSVGSLKTFNISVSNPRETLLASGSEVTLPTAEPASGAASAIAYTVLTGDLPVVTPVPHSVKYSAYLYASGKNPTGGTVTLVHTLYKNNVAVTGNISISHTVATNLFWTHSYYNFYDVQAGDVLEARIWTTTTGAYLDYSGIQIVPTRLELTKTPIVQDLTYTLTFPLHLTLGGSPSPAVGANWNISPSSNQPTVALGFQSSCTLPVACINSSATGYSGRIQNGDSVLFYGPQTHATNHPYFYKNLYPSSISFRKVLR